eukprot:TRINITY_DN2016_c0_g1_i1.p2 TRINITY_DN2016_c0_g1~~TRINITY_DN2016_c0_g1_i1.p2  ORF type:complete len:443 (+),score=156.69 TRINITY_DN2016_c0_g1_i1:55-1329(+)
MEIENPFQIAYDEAVGIQEVDPARSARLFEELIQKDGSDPDQQKIKENAIYRLGEILVKQGQASEFRRILVDLRPFFAIIPKARTAKIVRILISDMLPQIPNSEDLQIELCKECIEWCKGEKRTFLRQRMEARLAALLLHKQDYKGALRMLEGLLREVRKLDDKLLLVELQLLESRIHLALRNVPKAKAALTSSRAAANAIYCPPALQAQIDKQAGTLCAEEKDYKTAYSYFFESFEGFNTLGESDQAVMSLKYMLLSKIMTNSASDVNAIIHGKSGVKYAGIQVEAMRAVAEAYKERSIKALDQALAQYRAQLVEDPIIQSHIQNLYDTLLEQNLIRIIEPFSRVQIAHVAELINLPLNVVEARLSEMILDKKFFGILDQGAGDLIVYENVETDKTYDSAISTIKEMGNVVDRLYSKAKRLGY